jgi:hypothetical protein
MHWRIGINEAVNGVFLPADLSSANVLGATVHATLHTSKYYSTINAMLQRATSREEVIAILGVIRDKLLAGGL